MKKRLKVPCLYDTDKVAKNIWLSLARDFRASEGLSFCRKAEAAFLTGAKTYRDYTYPELGDISVGRFKRYKQMQELLKKYRFAQDAYSDEELHKKTLQKYFAEQERLASSKPMSMIGHRVLREARAIARTVLGPYEPDLAVIHSRFGKKSSIGCPMSQAYIDIKLSNVSAFTGSSSCTKWFWSSVLTGDRILLKLVEDLGVKPEDPTLMHESLNLICVPKSWKTYRSITPLTLLSLFYSNGVGKLVTERLRATGLDISRLQSRHQRLVKSFSMSKTHATADLSAASDSITIELLNRILPREWFCAIKRALTHRIVYTGAETTAYTESVLPMGNGLTFPVETLVFYSIIRAIGNLAGIDGIYSVYGDDLIYPSKLHKYVVRLFPHFKLQLNLDKTFVRYPFRESCGADFYRGADVRPFYLQGERQLLTRSKYQAFLYKTINGLMRRWDTLEIRQTPLYLITELCLISNEIYRVPPGYPDTAGIKVSSPRHCPLGLEMLPWAQIFCVCSKSGNSWWTFPYLGERAGSRFVKTVLPYYWLALQGETDDVEEGEYSSSKQSHPITDSSRRSSLRWEKSVYKRSFWDKGRRRTKRIVRFTPTVASRTKVQYIIRDGLIYEWV